MKLSESVESELNFERYEPRKSGSSGFFYPAGIHNDVFWGATLAVYATVDIEQEPFLVLIHRI